jgi:hypothetical protein
MLVIIDQLLASFSMAVQLDLHAADDAWHAIISVDTGALPQLEVSLRRAAQVRGHWLRRFLACATWV